MRTDIPILMFKVDGKQIKQYIQIPRPVLARGKSVNYSTSKNERYQIYHQVLPNYNGEECDTNGPAILQQYR